MGAGIKSLRRSVQRGVIDSLALGSFLPEDGGPTFAAQAGARYRATFVVTRSGGHITLRASVAGEGYRVSPDVRPRHTRAEPEVIRLNGGEINAGRHRPPPHSGSSFTAEFDV